MFKRLVRQRYALSAVAVVVITVAVLSLTAHQRHQLTLLERWLQDTLAPVQQALFRAGKGVDRELERWRAVRSFWVEHEALSEQASRVDELQHRLAELVAENQRLRELIGFAETLPGEYVAALVIGRNPDNWFQTITINRGRAHGIGPNDPVVVSKGLVGRVTTVSEHAATVMLILDPESGVAAMVQRTRDTGVALGVAGDDRHLHLRMFFREAAVEPGDVITSSGLSHLFPKGLRIGVVVGVSLDHAGLVRTAQVRPAVDFDRLEEVLVIRGLRRAGP